MRTQRSILGLFLIGLLIVMGNCSAPPSGTQDLSGIQATPPAGPGGSIPAEGTRETDGGSTEVGNPPALSLAPRNPVAKVRIVRQEEDKPSRPVDQLTENFYEWTVGWEPPEAPVITYKVERKIGQQGNWEVIGTTDPSQLNFQELGAYGATHYFRIKAIDAGGNFDYSIEFTSRRPTYCDFASGWTMVLFDHGCYEWTGLWVLDRENAAFVGRLQDGKGMLVLRQEAVEDNPVYRHIPLDFIPTSVWAADSAHVFVGGYTDKGRSEKEGRVILYDSGEARDLEFQDRRAIRSLFGLSASQVYAVGEGGTVLSYDGSSWREIASLSNPKRTYHKVWGLGPNDLYLVGAGGLFLHFNGSRWEEIPLGAFAIPSQIDFLDIWGADNADLYLASTQGLVRFNGKTFWKPGTSRYVHLLWGPDADTFYGIDSALVLYRQNGGLLQEEVDHNFWKITLTAIHGAGDQIFATTSNGLILKKFPKGSWEDIWTGTTFASEANRKKAPVDAPAAMMAKNILFGEPSPLPLEKSVGLDYWELAGLWHLNEKEIFLLKRTLGTQSRWELVKIDGAKGTSTLLPGSNPRPGYPYSLVGGPNALFIGTSAGLYRYTLVGGAFEKMETNPFKMFTSTKVFGDDLFALGRKTVDGGQDHLLNLSLKDGATRVIEAAPAGVRYQEIGGNGPQDLYVVALRREGERTYKDWVLHYDGTALTRDGRLPLSSGPSEISYRLIGGTPGRFLIVQTEKRGDDEQYRLYTFDGTAWQVSEPDPKYRTLFGLSPSGELIPGIPDPGYETTSMAAVNSTNLWAIVNRQFIFRYCR